jgi:hypothetical protein
MSLVASDAAMNTHGGEHNGATIMAEVEHFMRAPPPQQERTTVDSYRVFWTNVRTRLSLL